MAQEENAKDDDEVARLLSDPTEVLQQASDRREFFKKVGKGALLAATAGVGGSLAAEGAMLIHTPKESAHSAEERHRLALEATAAETGFTAEQITLMQKSYARHDARLGNETIPLTDKNKRNFVKQAGLTIGTLTAGALVGIEALKTPDPIPSGSTGHAAAEDKKKKSQLPPL